jgi:cell wall-associated NlpC family hydrolase
MRIAVTYAILLLTLALPARAADDLQSGLKELSAPLLGALDLLGTPYRMGGRRPETGLDCSGLVRYVYKKTHGIDLPHNARDISRQGVPVDPSELRPGDLVFFNTLGRPFSHVGIYKGDGKFVHASSRRDRKVTVSDMGNRYWAARFDGARRITLSSP